MTVQTQAQGTKSAAVLTMGTLASGAYIVSNAIDLTAVIPLALTIESEATPGTTAAGNLQVAIFALWSLDGTNYSTPAAPTAATEPQMHFLGVIPVAGTALSRVEIPLFDIRGRYMKLVAKNDCGVALASGQCFTAAWTGVST